MQVLVGIKEIKMDNVYHFILVLDGVDEKTSGLEDALCEAGGVLHEFK